MERHFGHGLVTRSCFELSSFKRLKVVWALCRSLDVTAEDLMVGLSGIGIKYLECGFGLVVV